ncbi:ATP-grasp domain-containing protein [Streptomyces azureus]|uniref:Phosphoribosylglycinamide synthetase n=1 Tax=Streptomyces azureus TaxID=146537 RepID=A0A0K8PEF3_STRAJ|nr:ATP-grasp domain-containing protein [Streptomyces azureus]GAP46276.1 phosphoribosylglycinamide synthetase [Streptomyces azureus]
MTISPDPSAIDEADGSVTTADGPVVMVDVYAPTMRLAEAFIAAGRPVVRVQSTPEVPPVYRASFRADIFLDNIVHEGDLKQTAKAVSAHVPAAVLTGGELGVELADQLSELLGLATNGTAHSAARRDKFRQMETVKQAGIPGSRQILAESAGQLADFHRELGGRVVVKPIRSAGNDGVHFCETPEDSAAAYRAIAQAVNIFSFRNEGVVAQEFLHGTEYVVNTVSCRGGHRATDVWKYTKISVNGVSNRISGALSVAPGEPARAALVAYAFDVLDALEVRHGPAHLEIMLTPDGPRLVEAGIRLCGADTAYYARLATGESQVERTVDAYLNPTDFLHRLGAPHRTEHHVAMAFLTSPVSGTLKSYPLLGLVEELESFHNAQTFVRPGEQLPLTVDDTTEPMMIGLAHPDRAVLERDFATVCYLDGHGFYELEPAGAAS